MAARRKIFIPGPITKSLRAVVEGLDIQEPKRNALLKDIFLIDLAMVTHKRIASLDDAARTNFKSVSTSVHVLKSVLSSSTRRSRT
jgi:hypothetical protein